jgi:uncharacterized protein with PIN domain
MDSQRNVSGLNNRGNMNKCPYCNQIILRPIAQAVESTNNEVVVLVSCPSCLKIIGVTRL